VCSAGAGPAPIPFKELSMERLAKALEFVVSPEVTEAAGRLGEQIRAEDGPQKGADSFHRQLPLKNML
jgi:sterol 3beta-glucosyltransferase